jgi:hypothetical protein
VEHSGTKIGFFTFFVPLCARPSGTERNKHRRFSHFRPETLLSAPFCLLARLAQGGAVYWALRVFSPNRAKDSAKSAIRDRVRGRVHDQTY